MMRGDKLMVRSLALVRGVIPGSPSHSTVLLGSTIGSPGVVPGLMGQGGGLGDDAVNGLDSAVTASALPIHLEGTIARLGHAIVLHRGSHLHPCAPRAPPATPLVYTLWQPGHSKNSS